MIDIKLINQLSDLKFLILFGIVYTIGYEAILFSFDFKKEKLKRMGLGEYIFQFISKTIIATLTFSGIILTSSINGSDGYLRFIVIFLIAYIIWKCRRFITILYKEIVTLVKDRMKK